jgi:catechol 2,3-dioxygenase-like lactoylglutathione lyase family enzyme
MIAVARAGPTPGSLTSTEERSGSAARRVYRATQAGKETVATAKLKVRELFEEEADLRHRLKAPVMIMPVSARYIVTDVDAAIRFYTEALDFKVDIHPAPGFARLSRGDLHLLLNRPGTGGAGQAMPTGEQPTPGGWNRIQIEVGDLAASVEKLRGAGWRFRGDIIAGTGGKQVLIEDPSGTPVELFEPFAGR